MWRGVGDRTELQHIDSHSSSPGLLNRGTGGAASLGHVLLPASSLQLQLLNWEPEGALCCVLAFSTASSPTHWTSCAPSYTIVHVHLLLVGVTNRTHSTCPQSRLYSDIPRPDAPVIYTGAYPILTTRPGRRSMYNTRIDINISRLLVWVH